METTNAINRNEPNTNDIIPISSDDEGQQAPPILENRQAGKKTRFKWTMEMNTHLYRAYLHITRVETDTAPYGRRLHEEMLRRFPELRNKTVQNILDQRRQLAVKQRLPLDIMRECRREVAEELGMAVVVPTVEPTNRQRQTIIVGEDERTAFEVLQKNILLYSGMSQTQRPRIPKLRTSKLTPQVIGNINKALERTIHVCNDITSLHDCVYAAAMTAIELHHQNILTPTHATPRDRLPAWETRLDRKIQEARKEIGILTQYVAQTPHSKRVENKAKTILQKHRNENNRSALEILDLLKQRLQVYANRLRRYKEAYQRRMDNKMFEVNQRAFYRNLQTTNRDRQNNATPGTEDIKKFWSNIWEKPVVHTRNTTWIKQERRRTEKVPLMASKPIDAGEVKQAIAGTLNWKAAGPDRIQNFWYKKFTALHENLAHMLNMLLDEPELVPDFLTEGTTYLLPKTTPSVADPAKYRPITCLPTLYKLLTSILANRIYTHMDANGLLADEQKGCRRQTQGCKDQLTMDAVITEHAKKDKRDLHTAFIDYEKAFDSVPHSWLVEVLTIYKIDPQIIELLKHVMSKWKINISTEDRDTDININIQRGIFQGDALSALWFCIALNPLSNALNRGQNGYHLDTQSISHLMYMDDIKILSGTMAGLRRSLRTTEEFSNDIRMNFGLDKCKTNHLRKGQWHESEDFKLLKRTGGGSIAAMSRHETYKYLGVAQSQGINNEQMKRQLMEQLQTRLRLILKTQLSGSNKVKATNSFAVSTVTYSFGILRWTPTDLENMNRTIRTAFTKYRAHHPKACKERFHIPRSEGGRGVIDLRLRHKEQIGKLREYFYKKATTSSIYQDIVHSDKNLTPLNLNHRQFNPDDAYTSDSQRRRWQEKELHGRYANVISQAHIDKRASVAWLTQGSIFSETEGFICAIQDQVIATRTYLKHIVKDPGILEAKCRMCGNQQETIEHIISGCQTLASREYTSRHNNVAKIIHSELRVIYGFSDERTPYYKYTPDTILENDACKIYWDRDILTDRTVQNNRPDIAVLDKEKNILTFIEVAIPAPANIQRKYREKSEKYLPLAQDAKETWRVQEVKIVPIVIGATGEIPKTLLNNLEALGMPSHMYQQMQKSVILSTCNIMRKVLNKPKQEN